MTFRSNMFGEQIAQPGTELSDIEQMLSDMHMPDRVDLNAADVYTSGDEEYKFGGSLHFVLETGDEGSDDVETKDVSVEFDGFETFEAARDFVRSLGVMPGGINVMD